MYNVVNREGKPTPYAAARRLTSSLTQLATRRIAAFAKASVVSAIALASSILSADAQVVPTAPLATHEIAVFPSRDFVSISGFTNAIRMSIEVYRDDPATGDLVMTGNTPDIVPDGGAAEVNHAGAHCWGEVPGIGFVTPDIKGGDIVRVVYSHEMIDPLTGLVVLDPTTLQPVITNSAEQITVSHAIITRTAYVPAGFGPDTVVVHGVADRGDGRQMDLGTFEVEILTGGALFPGNRRVLLANNPAINGIVVFDQPNNRDNPAFTATFTGLAPEDVEKAITGETAVVVPVPGSLSITKYEGNGDPPGPAATCASPLDAPVGSVNPAAVYFTATTLSTTASRQIVLNNVGAGAFGQLHVTNITVQGADAASFTVTGNACGNVAVGGSCVITVNMLSAIAGEKAAEVVIVSDSRAGVIRVPIVGLVVSAPLTEPYLVARPQLLDMGSRALGVQSDSKPVTVVNLSTVAATAVTGQIAGGNALDFTIFTQIVGPLAAGASAEIGVVMTPFGDGIRQSTLSVTAAGSTRTAFVTLQGVGINVGNVIEPPPAPIAIVAFPGRDFVVGEGLPSADGQLYTFQVMRHGEIIAQSAGHAPVDGVVEINHPGNPCWQRVVPDIRRGDRIRLVSSLGPIYQTYVADIALIPNPTNSATSVIPTGPDSFVIHGRAADENGRPIPLDQIAVELISGSANPFVTNSRRGIGAPGDGTLEYDPVDPISNPDGTRFTVTFEDLFGDDVNRAMFESDQAALWLGRTPHVGTELTKNEFGAGPEGGCVPVAPETIAPPLEVPTGDTQVRPTSLIFPPRTAGTFFGQILTIYNPGPTNVTISSLVISGVSASSFTIRGITNQSTLATGFPMTLTLGQSAVVGVRFTSSGAAGLREAALTIVDDVAGSTPVTLRGDVVAQAITYITTTNTLPILFPNTPVNDTAIIPVRIFNRGQRAMAADEVLTFAITGPDADQFRLVANVDPLNNGASRNISLRYRPSRLGHAEATYTVTYVPLPGAAPVTYSIPAKAYSGVTADGFNDPPVGRSIAAFHVREYVIASGFAANEIVDIEVLRPRANNPARFDLIGSSIQLIPIDDPLTLPFDGVIEINHVGAACWDGPAPDLAPGDIIRAVSYDINDFGVIPVALSRNQIVIHDIETTSRVIQTAADTVVVTGHAKDIRLGTPLALGAMEVRIKPVGGFLFSNGRAELRTGGDGPLESAGGNLLIATFSGLSAADVALALLGDPKILWLGRSPETGVEQLHVEWNENPGEQAPNCFPQLGALLEFPGEPATPSVITDLGVSGVNLGVGQSAFIPITNTGNGPTTITNLSIVGLHPADFIILGGTCNGATVNPLQSCTVEVAIAATADGLRHGSLRVGHTSNNNPEFHSVTGRGVGAPSITSITPNRAGSNSVVTITGANFTGILQVQIGGLVANALTFVNDSTVTVRVPGGTVGVAVDVSVATLGGAATLPASFTLLPNAPNILTLTLPAPPVWANKQIIITGDYLNTVTNVTMGGLNATSVLNADGTLTVTIPNGAPASSVIVLTAPGGSALSAPVAVVQPPRFTLATPASARTGIRVTFTGTDLGLLAGTTLQSLTSVTFPGAAPVTAITRISATSVSLVVPAAAQIGPITLAGPAGTTTFNGFTVLRAPTVTRAIGEGRITGSTTATNLTGRGRTITVHGTGFAGVTQVTVGGTRTTAFTVNNLTNLTVVVPAAALTGNQTVTVTTAGGTGTKPAANVLTVVAAPTITSFTPLSGRVGAVVTISGANLQFVDRITLSGQVIPAFTRVGTGAAQRLSFTVPAGSLSGAVGVQSLGGTASSVQAFRVIQ